MIVYIVTTPLGYILGVYSKLEDAQAVRQAMGPDCSITKEPVVL